MSDAENYSHGPALLTITGQIAVHYLDGQTIQGEFVSQDTFNVFLIIDGEPIMISRSQIRYIKGQDRRQISEDRSQDSIITRAEDPLKTEELMRPLDRARPPQSTSDGMSVAANQAEAAPISAPPPVEQDEPDEDGTVILAPGQLLSEDEAEDEDDDGTMVINIDDFQFDVDDDDDDGTLVLGPADIDLSPLSKDSAPTDDGDEMDATVVIPDTGELEEEDATVIIRDEPDADPVPILICTGGPLNGETLKLQGGITTLGRSSDNVIVLAGDNEISRHHAIIMREGKKFVLQDQNSLNGTYVNDKQIAGPYYLEDGDSILVGLSSFIFEDV